MLLEQEIKTVNETLVNDITLLGSYMKEASLHSSKCVVDIKLRVQEQF